MQFVGQISPALSISNGVAVVATVNVLRMTTNALRNKRTSGKTRWLRVGELPFSRATTYRMIEEDLLDSISLRLPGSGRTIRLIDGDSLDRYLLSLQKKQRRETVLEKGK
jgi:hypothetical protein